MRAIKPGGFVRDGVGRQLIGYQLNDGENGEDWPPPPSNPIKCQRGAVKAEPAPLRPPGDDRLAQSANAGPAMMPIPKARSRTLRGSHGESLL